ncbi:MAG: polyprenol monophosphomannose synthase [Anaerolineales bacterium]|nr:polyprenol monophosphomannose synthase [Anaerolineales bacterium]
MRTIVIIPTYNEAENLPELVSALFALPLDLSVLVVDDNSPDGTGQIAEELANIHPDRIHVIHREKKDGLRSAYLTGFKTALQMDAEALVQMDADFSHDPAVLVEMAETLKSCDLVIGSRYISGGAVDDAWPNWRKGLSAFGNNYARTILNVPIRDMTTGYRMWRADAIRGMPLGKVKAKGYVFMVEIAYLAYCLDYRIVEVPIYFADRKLGKSKMSIMISFEAAWRVWKVLIDSCGMRRKGKAARLG